MAVPEPCKQCGRLAYPGEAVTISGEEYRELLRLRQARNIAKAIGLATGLNKRTGIARDAELASFILEGAETMMPKAIEASAVERFGRERVPSRSTITRFLHGLGRR